MDRDHRAQSFSLPSMLAAENDAAGLSTVRLLHVLADAHNGTLTQLRAAEQAVARAARAGADDEPLTADDAVPTLSYRTPYEASILGSNCGPPPPPVLALVPAQTDPPGVL